MFGKNPLAWLLLLFTYYLLVGIAEFGPWARVGQVVAPVLKPLFTVGFLAAAWTQERGGSPRFALLFRGFRSNLYALIPLGIVFLAGITLAVLSTVLVDDGKLIGILSGTEKLTLEVLVAGQLTLPMLFGAACALPTLFALWFAPALVVFEDAGAGTALATSFRASITNWRPVATYGAVVFAFGGIIPSLVLSVGQLLGETVAGMLALFVVLPYFFAFIATLHISDYVSYRDVFHPNEAIATESAPLA
jgi:hypothetical protein